VERPIRPILNGHIIVPYGVKGPWWDWHINKETGLWTSGQINRKGNHSGYDFLAAVGTDCLATNDGIVRYYDRHPKLGTFLILQLADATVVTYSRLSKILVVEGASVKQGDVIALSGKADNNLDPHLHISFLDPQTHQWFQVDFKQGYV
jgi:murein DD-endopeptidase MepM/ murein hydrolase activator NlpD